MKKILIFIFIITLLVVNFNLVRSSRNSSYSQKIDIPFDTSLPEAKLQPVDININFDHPCWAEDEINNSVRVFYEGSYGVNELESQIYDLKFSGKSHISSCRLVFLIPYYADGKETYYVRYSSSKAQPIRYRDHVGVKDTHYYYEPIPGQKIDFEYFRITDDGYIVYGVMQSGILLDTKTCHTIIKLKPNSTKFETINADQFAAFAFKYDNKQGETGTDWSKRVDKSILVDGNLMVRIRIRSISPDKKVETDNIYTYYHSPGTTKRIIVRVNHKILKDIQLKKDAERDGVYAALSTFKSRSSSIKNMNVGNILPYLHFYDSRGLVQSVNIPSNPNTKDVEWIVSTRDDRDLGKMAWVSMDDNQKKMHAIIFNSNTNISNEDDGLQLKLGIKEDAKLPGLEADSCSAYICRNSYTKKSGHDLTIDGGTNISFEAEFVTFESGNIEVLNREASIYQKLSAFRQIEVNKLSNRNEAKRYNLTVRAHLSPSFPMGTLLSAATGKNFSYLYTEVYRNDSIVSSGSLSRLPLSGSVPSFENKTMMEKLKTIVSLFDWKNASIFRQITIPNLQEGTYIVKIYKENPLFFKERRFVGFGKIHLRGDTKTDIFCSPEVKLQVSIRDQYGNRVNNLELELMYDNTTLERMRFSGDVTVGFPYKLRGYYKLHVLYDGFKILDRDIKTRSVNIIKPIEIRKNLKLFNLKVRLRDSWGLPPGGDILPTLTSKEMLERRYIKSEKIDGFYVFRFLYPSLYTLSIDYRDMEINRDVYLKNDSLLEINFTALHRVSIHVRDYYGIGLGKVEAILSRFNKRSILNSSNGIIHLSIPPGNYMLKIVYGEKLVAETNLVINGNKDFTIITSGESLYHVILFYIGITLMILSGLILILRRDISLFISMFSISLLSLSIYFPWWILSGRDIDVYNKITIFPAGITSFVSTDSTYGGEMNILPQIISGILVLVLILLILSSILIVASILFKTRKKRSIATVLSIFFILSSILIFYFSISKVTEIGVGSFIGHGRIDISVLNEQLGKVYCSWGPDYGFYLSLLSLATILLSLMINIKIKTNKKKISF